MHTLCQRLMLAADYVRKGSRIVDIGTDHAYLPVYLISNNIAVRALACDLRKGPLSNAKKTVTDAGLGNLIELRLSDGLKNVDPVECDDIIICGMGGTLISNILAETDWIQNEKFRLILQPQSHLEDVRNYLIKNGFEIRNESTCFDMGRPYIAMYAEFTGILKEYPEDYIWFGMLPEIKNDAAKVLFEAQLNLLKIKMKSEAEYGSEELSEKYNKIINLAEKRFNGDK